MKLRRIAAVTMPVTRVGKPVIRSSCGWAGRVCGVGGAWEQDRLVEVVGCDDAAPKNEEEKSGDWIVKIMGL